MSTGLGRSSPSGRKKLQLAHLRNAHSERKRQASLNDGTKPMDLDKPRGDSKSMVNDDCLVGRCINYREAEDVRRHELDMQRLANDEADKVRKHELEKQRLANEKQRLANDEADKVRKYELEKQRQDQMLKLFAETCLTLSGMKRPHTEASMAYASATDQPLPSTLPTTLIPAPAPAAVASTVPISSVPPSPLTNRATPSATRKRARGL